jgi:hypothetical protein
MECQDINGLKLDADDWDAIDDIRRRQRAGNMLEIIMPAGALATIFLGNNAGQAAFNISGFDFVQFAKAMTKIDGIVRGRIEYHARIQYLTPGKSNEQKQFWKSIAQGCGAK